MPERRHYGNEVLDNCYVFTFDEKYKAGLYEQCDRAYDVVRLFRKDNNEIKNITLKNQNRAEKYEMLGARDVALKLIDFLRKKYSIELNDRGNLIKWVQERLTQLGFDAGYADGFAEKPTMDAIYSWQKANGLGVGNLYGSDWDVLLA
jgi:hypothetical protein